MVLTKPIITNILNASGAYIRADNNSSGYLNKVWLGNNATSVSSDYTVADFETVKTNDYFYYKGVINATYTKSGMKTSVTATAYVSKNYNEIRINNQPFKK